MDWLALWHLAILVMALGLGWALDLPSRRSFIYDMMGPRRIVNALALDHLGMDGAKMLGPILGGLLWPVIGLGGCFLILAAGYVVNFYLYLGLVSAEPKRVTNPGPVLRNLAEGLAYVLHDPVILGVLAITVVLNFLGFPYQNLVPVVAKQDLGLGPRLTGALLATEGLGAICGSLLVASRREVPHKGRIFICGSALVLAAILLFSFSSWPGISFLLLFIAGAGIAGFATMQSSVILLSASDAMRGRAMGTLILAIGFGPLGAIQIGVLASAFGVAPAITMTIGAGLLLLVAILWWNTALWHFGSNGRQSPTAPASPDYSRRARE
jgi:predicted MFS family arabinose efflux permease